MNETKQATAGEILDDFAAKVIRRLAAMKSSPTPIEPRPPAYYWDRAIFIVGDVLNEYNPER